MNNDTIEKLEQVERVLAEASACLSGAFSVLAEVKTALGKGNAVKGNPVKIATAGDLLRICNKYELERLSERRRSKH